MRDSLSELEKKMNENEINFERRKLEYEIKINQAENTNKTLQNLLKKIEEEKKLILFLKKKLENYYF